MPDLTHFKALVAEWNRISESLLEQAREEITAGNLLLAAEELQDSSAHKYFASAIQAAIDLTESGEGSEGEAKCPG
jgi:hypothetical protein